MEQQKENGRGSKIKKIGMIGGSFDPVHYGHLLLAEQARQEAGLDQVVFMPAYVSPFKVEEKAAAPKEKAIRPSDRLWMVKTAIRGNPAFVVSSMEIEKASVSYTAQTIRKYKELCSQDQELWFITGADAFLEIERWKDASYLLNNVGFIIGLRPGFFEDALDALIERLQKNYGTQIRKLYSPQVDISSSLIRRLIAEGKSPRYLLPDTVLDYIRKQGFYSSDIEADVSQKEDQYPGVLNFQELKKVLEPELKARLKPSRLLHTYGVAKEAVALAKRYGGDEEKAEICGLFHDIKREKGNLEHGAYGAACMEEDYHIRDVDMLNAVRYHTTGRENMSLLEKIIYQADAIDPSRNYPGIEKLRKKAYEDLDEACLLAMERSIEYVRMQGLTLDENTIKAQNFLRKKEKV